MTPIETATDADVEPVAGTLAAAFAAYPWTTWTVAADDHARRVRDLQALYLRGVGLPQGRVHVTPARDGAAVWLPPDVAPPADEGFGAALVAAHGDRWDAALAAEGVLDPVRPDAPHWTLATLGVHPESAGRGLGTALLRAGLEALDAAGEPAWLETSDPRNVRLYERVGFATTFVVELPDGGPTVWGMRRPA
ncbi:GNAT family N-acetyltransferase [Patulibacter sp. SYSU D01012]|uniref:GNAT family N-acetyltransferase n=1 Tax=Patulibacter sp. SYSU D01012 TaxID=2817381 RepID=UPI001B305AE3|nr:GNAT family N-acetyltransferase [Patulibacter sp. SYSU D01012]